MLHSIKACIMHVEDQKVLLRTSHVPFSSRRTVHSCSDEALTLETSAFQTVKNS